MGKTDKLLSRVLAKVTPSKAEIAEEMRLFEELKARIKAISGKHVDVVLAGSIARGTHLRGDRDIDIFVLFPQDVPREEFEKEGLAIGKKIFRGHEWEKAYTQHPYIRGVIEGFEVEIVPSYKVGHAGEMKSAVDRSPLHTEYLLRKLGEKQKGEVRLLRQFLKGVGCYGADTKCSSFPGYVAELLVLKYGGFIETINAAAEWRMGEVIDLEGHYKGAEKAALDKFGSHLVVVDPTDKNRNVAAALSPTQYARFVAAARAFLKKPSEAFFFPPKVKPWPMGKVKKLLQKKELAAVLVPYPKGVVADIMWGQLRRFAKKVANHLRTENFVVNRSSEWTDEKNAMVVLFEVEALTLQKTMKRIGPEVTNAKHGEAFLRAHPKLIAGPRIEDGRWVIEIERKHPNMHALLKETLKKEKRVEREQMKRALNKGAKVLGERGILALYKKNKGFAEYFTEYLKGKEDFEF